MLLQELTLGLLTLDMHQVYVDSPGLSRHLPQEAP